MSTDQLNDARDFILFPRETFTNGLSVFQVDHAQWSAYNFDADKRTPDMMLFGIVEEVGELAHATLKHRQGIRGFDDAKFEELSKDAAADLFVFLTGYCTARGWNLGDIVAETWTRVRERDWRVNKANGGDATPTTQGATP